MIIRINRGSIMVSLHEKTITIAGEMFFPPNDKIGFLLYSASLKLLVGVRVLLKLQESNRYAKFYN